MRGASAAAASARPGSSTVRCATRAFHFATPAFAKALRPVPTVDTSALRAAALDALDRFDSKSWQDHPIASLLHGERLAAGTRVETRDAFGRPNGAQLLATDAEMAAIVEHATRFQGEVADLRVPVRAVEARMLDTIGGGAGELIAHQLLDFGKQDGVTEIEEALQANAVERRLNDGLLGAESRGEVKIGRRVALATCVSNFTNFLDFSRKALRNLELGVPVLLLSRSNTSQHAFRWAERLARELQREGVNPAMLTFASASLEQQQFLLGSAAAASAATAASKADTVDTTKSVNALSFAPPLLVTSGRSVAAALKAQLPGTIASTGGPNLILNLTSASSLAAAARLSATIEHSGQCTALRVLVTTPEAAEEQVLVESLGALETAVDARAALTAGHFAALLDSAEDARQPPPEGYTQLQLASECGQEAKPSSVCYKVAETLPGDGGAAIAEHWRRPVLDVVAPPGGEPTLCSESFIGELSAWLTQHQPISLAINGAAPGAEPGTAPPGAAPAHERHLQVARQLFERSALAVYTVGDEQVPALCVAARPQDGEIFAELPPAVELERFTCFPMAVPASQPSYFTHYEPAHLARRAAATAQLAAEAAAAGDDRKQVDALCALVSAARAPAAAGFLIELADYLRAAARGPTIAPTANRTALFGLQRPPLLGRSTTVLRCAEETPLDALLPLVLPFALTNAASQVEISVHPANREIRFDLARLEAEGGERLAVRLRTETDAQYSERTAAEAASIYNKASLSLPFSPLITTRLFPNHHLISLFGQVDAVNYEDDAWPLVGQWVMRLMPFGHVKHARGRCEPFLRLFVSSSKWLKWTGLSA